MYIQNTTIPYDILPHNMIQYNVCRDYSHISRYRQLRPVTHNPYIPNDRFIALETPKQIDIKCKCKYYTVPAVEEDRLDVIAHRFLGTANYSWLLAYVNHIEDGYTVKEGQKLKIPTSITELFNKGEMLSSINPFLLNLGTE